MLGFATDVGNVFKNQLPNIEAMRSHTNTKHPNATEGGDARFVLPKPWDILKFNAKRNGEKTTWLNHWIHKRF